MSNCLCISLISRPYVRLSIYLFVPLKPPCLSTIPSVSCLATQQNFLSPLSLVPSAPGPHTSGWSYTGPRPPGPPGTGSEAAQTCTPRCPFAEKRRGSDHDEMFFINLRHEIEV